ncbi:type II secretion system protein N [Novosphingobium sp. LASN5T]|uniref:type II secretion system protein N n=1 Tax=Novosphingobium sp. LASN5T TaxID=2491021 RepID=UPI000F5EB695|nr:type II secretion system protein N [Novosphingobium sp. LASN5T]RQW43780.1 hypothetical protein EH199_11105 [Novosphingobium sp. LASN5T]
MTVVSKTSAMPRRAVPVLIAVFLAALVVLMPLRIVLGWAGGALSARYVDGPVWWGRAYDLRIGPVPVGTVDAGLRPLPLLIGRAETWLERPAGTGQAPLRARIGGGAGGLRLADATGSLPLPEGLGQLPASTIGFDQFAVDFADGRCRSASGTLTVTLAPVSALMPKPLPLTGKARCQDGALVVPMADSGGMAHLLLKVAGTGGWTADLSLAGLPVEISGPLVDEGFSARPGGIGFRTGGTF